MSESDHTVNMFCDKIYWLSWIRCNALCCVYVYFRYKIKLCRKTDRCCVSIIFFFLLLLLCLMIYSIKRSEFTHLIYVYIRVMVCIRSIKHRMFSQTIMWLKCEYSWIHNQINGWCFVHYMNSKHSQNSFEFHTFYELITCKII